MPGASLPASREPDARACNRGLRRQAIVQSLLADVLQGRLRAGDHLGTQDLADRFGVSHTPIREALIALAGIGIVDLNPNRGAVVRRVSSREAYEVMQVRRALESMAARSACGRIELAELHDLADRFRELIIDSERCGNGNGKKDVTPAAVLERARGADSRLHDCIAESCRNAFLAQELGRLKALFRAFRDLAWEEYGARNDYRRLAEESREHLTIVEALLAGDAKGAARAMSRHIRSGARYWSRGAFAAGSFREPTKVADSLRESKADSRSESARKPTPKKPLARSSKGSR
jgi:DNA-binding GntR family transcriptional regulator